MDQEVLTQGQWYNSKKLVLIILLLLNNYIIFYRLIQVKKQAYHKQIFMLRETTRIYSTLS